MSTLRESSLTKHLAPKEEQPELLRSSKMSKGGSSLGFKSNSPYITDEVLLDYLAALLVDIFITKYESEQTGSHILPGVNKRTS